MHQPEPLRTFIFRLGDESSYVDGTSVFDARSHLVHRRGARWRASSYEGWQGTQDPIPEEPLHVPWLAIAAAVIFLCGLAIAVMVFMLMTGWRPIR